MTELIESLKRRTMIFVLLKVVEIAALVFVPYWLGEAIPQEWFTLAEESAVTCWMRGLLVLLMGVLVILMGILLVAANWSWAANIHRKLTRKEAE